MVPLDENKLPTTPISMALHKQVHLTLTTKKFDLNKTTTLLLLRPTSPRLSCLKLV